jgi:hypothetical protein
MPSYLIKLKKLKICLLPSPVGSDLLLTLVADIGKNADKWGEFYASRYGAEVAFMSVYYKISKSKKGKTAPQALKEKTK